MSSEHAFYRVESNTEVEQRAIAQAWTEVHRLQRCCCRLDERIRQAERDYGDGFRVPLGAPSADEPPASSGRAEIEHYERSLQAHFRRVNDAVGRAVIVAERRALSAEMEAHLEPGGMSADDLFSRPGPAVEDHSGDPVAPPGPSAEEQLIAVKNECVRVLDRLSTGVAVAERDVLDQIADHASQAQAGNQPGRARTLLLELRLGVQAANECWERDAERVASLRQELRGLDGADVRAVVDEIGRIERGEGRLTAAVVARAEKARDAARARADRKYAAAVMREEIERLGYQVEEGFASLFVEGGRTVARKTDEPGYGVAVDVDVGDFRVEPVRVGGSGSAESREPQRRRDLAFARRWCQDFARAREAMERRGVATDIAKRERAGTRPLKVVRDEEEQTGPERGRTGYSRRRESPRQRQGRSR